MQNKNVSMEQTSSQTKSFLDPKRIFDQLGNVVGFRIADFGSGAGHFSLEAARRVGKTGKVYALDILPQALESIESRALMESLDVIETKRVNLEKLGGSFLEDASMNMVIAKDMLFMNENKSIIIQEICRVLVLGGKALFVEWNSDQDNHIGPSREKRVLAEDLLQFVHECSFGDEKKIEVGDYHYGFLVTKK